MKVDPRFLTSEGAEIFTGNELLIKGALETEGGVHLLGGYPGSPAAAFFDCMATIKDLLIEKGIYAVMNNNEALAAAMLNGSQTLPIRAMIAMKSVGVHVAADGLALANLAGANPNGGAIVVTGDDPWSDSTQVPADSRYIFKHLHMPVIEPATPQETKDYVDMSFKLSRWCELLAGYVLTTNLADGGGTVQCRPNQYPTQISTNLKTMLDTAAIDLNKRVLLPPKTWWQEENLADRHQRALGVGRKLGFNQLLYPSAGRKPIGFVSSGMAHGYLVQALFEMGLLGEYPILKFGISYPLDAELIRQLTEQCERIVVVEERRGFMQEQIADLMLRERQLNKMPARTEVWGKTFPGGLKGIPETRGLHPSIIIARLAPLLKLIGGRGTQLTVPDWVEGLERELETIDSTAQATTELTGLPARTATFCPGCPHRDSAGLCLEIQKNFKDPQYMQAKYSRGAMDLIFHGDTGCYTMLMFPPTTSLMHDYSGMGIGGGTGSGNFQFVLNKEVVFMGDGTFFHSGQLAISQAIKLGQDITFIILENSTTAMTGHQPTSGVDYDIIGNTTAVQDLEDVVRGMAAGCDRVQIVRCDPSQRPKYREVLEQMFLADGVKIVIADKECGITRMRRKRRAERAEIRRRGFLKSWDHMNVNQDICRFCLACAENTGCPGLRHVETDYGPKMDTDMTWCVDDGACERVGACSAFEHVTIHRKRPPKSRLPELGLDDIPEPQRRPASDLWRCCLVGVGGMGIATATSIVVRAGHNEGYDVIFLDKKGLAIRNGGVISQVVYNVSKKPITAVIPFGKADLLVGIDVLEAARVLDPRGRTRIASRDRTAAVINTDKIATIRGLMGQDDFNPADLERLIESHTRADDFLARNISRICEKYLGSKLYANIMMLGFAFQKGLIPVSMHSMAWAIKDTIRADFRKNLYAFNMGRKLVIHRDLFQGPPKRSDWRDLLEEKCRWTIRRYRRGAKLAAQLRDTAAALMDRLKDVDESLKMAVIVRLYDCMRWGGIEHARRYAAGVSAVHAKDRQQYGFAATRAVIFTLASAMLIKDVVFMAELATAPEKRARDWEKYGVSPHNGDRMSYRHLWRLSLGSGERKRKVNFSPPTWTLELLKRAKFLRRIMPGCHRRRQFLQQYEGLIDAFTHASEPEYRRQVARLGGPQCMNCMTPRCQEEGCPMGSRISQWMDLAYQGKYRQAARLLHMDNNFPEFTSRICPARCQDKCKQSTTDLSVPIRQVERQIVDRAFAEGWITPQPPRHKTGRKVAVIGSGPAGLAAAQQLARAGHDVVVFEKDQMPGGLLRYGIPAWRLEKELIDRRVEQLQAEGVEFRTGVLVGSDITGDQLREEFDATLIACGATKPRDLHLPGRAAEGIYYALDFLRQSMPVSGTAPAQPSPSGVLELKGKTVVVIGGGETGNDCVEAALLGGAKAVHQFEIMPETGNDSGGGEHDAVSDDAGRAQRQWCIATKEFEHNGLGLKAVKAAKVRWQLTPSGKAMQEVPESEFRTPADFAVLAMGFDAVIERPLAVELGIATDSRGAAIVHDYATSVEGTFVAGDAVTGASIVAAAIASGRTAAQKINDYLSRPSENATADERVHIQ